ncbi:MAG: V-type ATP synthase subunit A [Promethearchaeota archaeon]
MTKSKNEGNIGYIISINGSLIKIKGIEKKARLYDLVKVVQHNIMGEVIQIHVDHVIAQCYEETFNLKLNQQVINLGEPLSMELGPGLLGKIFDGIQRPLEFALTRTGNEGFLKRGLEFPALSRTKLWEFKPVKKINDIVSAGDVIGVVKETDSILHKIMVPPGISGKITYVVKEGQYHVDDEIYRLKIKNEEHSFTMIQKWPITEARPYLKKLNLNEPLLTGLRVIDLLFPIAKGGSVAVPGGFGTGKTVIQQSLAKWCNADVIIFVGCGERGNEIADVLQQFSELKDPQTGKTLLNRIVLIANTSNMPVSAREASIFSGVTIGEYYRDMGYDVALLADSTSRWAESLREISGLLEEMPAEEGYPAYLPSKLSSFYERAGIVQVLGNSSNKKRMGSLTIIGSVSPPSGDFNEPVTSNTKRFVQAFWALDASLAYSKHYPAINWRDSYSNYPEYISDWWYERDIDWSGIELDWDQCRMKVNEILSIENDLKNITQLIGEENLPDEQQLVLFVAKIIKNGFLIQNAFNEIDCFTTHKKLLAQIKLILLFYQEARDLIRQGIIIENIKNLEIVNDILRVGSTIPNNDFSKLEDLKEKLMNEMDSLKSFKRR